MEINPNFTYMLYSATAEDNVNHKNHQFHLGKHYTLQNTANSFPDDITLLNTD